MDIVNDLYNAAIKSKESVMEENERLKQEIVTMDDNTVKLVLDMNKVLDEIETQFEEASSVPIRGEAVDVDTNAWKTVEYKIKPQISKELLDHNICLNNYYKPLAFMNNGPPSVNCDDDDISGIVKGIGSSDKVVEIKDQSTRRRPSPVINNFPEREKLFGKNVPVVPGNKPYNEAHMDTISVVTDSMSRSIKQTVMQKYLPGDMKVSFHKYPGHTADEISHYVQKNIFDDKPQTIIIIAGINDILKEKRVKDIPDLNMIVEHILDIGRVARENKVRHILISGIMVNKAHNTVVQVINDILVDRCKKEGFTYMDQSDITLKNLLSYDGLHLNSSGSAKLLHNLLRSCIEGYNPYIC